jgi:hypothetical protein
MTPSPRVATLLLTCLTLAGPGAGAQAPIITRTPSNALRRQVGASKITESLRIDGSLNETAWNRADVARDFTQSEPREGQPATEVTEVMVLFDDHFLYVGARMRDSDPAHAIVNDIRKDFREDDQDDFEVIIDTFRDRRNGYIFIVNPEGGRVDRQIANEGREINSSWDAVWDVKTQRSAEGWTAEMRIPFRTLRFDPGADQSWGINFSRRIRRKNEVTFWAPVPRAYNLMRLSYAGDVTGLHPGQAGRDVRVKPYLLNTTVRGVGGTSFDNEINGGVDAKVAVSRGLTLDLTVRPDFAQVEADEQQVNLTQFAQFFPEKRESFLENSGIFYVGDAARLNRVFTPPTPDDDNLLFFSRRIGIRDDRQPIDIDAGARLTGVAGGFGIGLINMQVRGDETTDANNYSVLRVRRNVGEGSDIGVLYMQRQSTDNTADYNRVAGLDANLRFFTSWDWNSYVVGTRTPGLSGEQYAARTSINHEDNFFHGKAGLMTLGDHFNNDLGFYRRIGIKKWFTDIGIRPRPEALRRRGIRELHPHIVWDMYTDQSNRMVQKRLHTGQTFFFENGAVLELSYNPAFNLLSAPLTLSPEADPLPAGPYGWNEFGILANTDLSRPLSLQSRWAFGELYNGTQKSVQATVMWRPNFRVRLSAGVQRTDGRLDLLDGKFVNAVYTVRANYSFSPVMFIDALSQYDPTTEQLNANVRFNLIHHPLSDLFVVYNDQRFLTTDAPTVGRSIAIKLTQMLSF